MITILQSNYPLPSLVTKKTGLMIYNWPLSVEVIKGSPELFHAANVAAAVTEKAYC